MNSLENLVGEICEKIFPISDKIYYGNPNF